MFAAGILSPNFAYDSSLHTFCVNNLIDGKYLENKAELCHFVLILNDFYLKTLNSININIFKIVYFNYHTL